MNDLKIQAERFRKKLEKIKCFVVDVDGVLTNGLVYYGGEEIGFNRFFHTLDGYGMKVLMEAGIKVGVISGGASVGLKKRVIENLQLDYAYLGDEDKRNSYLKLLKETKLSDDQILYIGDELFDIPLLKRVGFSATVPHASWEVKEVVDYITIREGGAGCVREVIDMLRFIQNIKPKIADFE